MRDYSSISPSAKGLLLMKGLTDIPFMDAAVKIVWGRPASTALGKRNIDPTFLKRLVHFEARYKSVDRLLGKLGGQHILEISSGFSFRGLAMALCQPGLTYIDTDLPDVIATKNDIIGQIIDQQLLDIKGDLLIMPMNALDEDSFLDTVSKLPAGPVTIINEGLLMYLNNKEKGRLCQIIHRVLSERGGYWITADIYIKKNVPLAEDAFTDFLRAHNVEENKFASFEQAEEFFNSQGFSLHQKAEPATFGISSLKYIPQHAIAGLKEQAAKIGRIRETWALKPILIPL